MPDNKLTIVRGAQRVGKTEAVHQMIHYAFDRGHFVGGIFLMEMEQAKEPNFIQKFVEKMRETVKNDKKPLEKLSMKDNFAFL